jgi:phage-related protein
MVHWLCAQIEKFHPVRTPVRRADELSPADGLSPAEAVDMDFAAALRGESPRLQWNSATVLAEPARWNFLWKPPRAPREIEVVHRVGSQAVAPS